MKRMARMIFAATLAVTVTAIPAAAQLSLQWMVPAAANTGGLNGTIWHTDLSIHNPQAFDLPVVLQFLPSDTDNRQAETRYVTLYPWETFNLWDALGPDGFAVNGTGAILVFADWSLACDPVEECDFLVTSRTYTLNPGGGGGEFGQTIPGSPIWQGIGWDSLGYAAGILNDGDRFRTNFGVASWTADWTTVAVDVQDAEGTIVDRLFIDVPPFGHVQRRLASAIDGGSLVFWIDAGPADPLVFGYASVVDGLTGDSSYQLAQPSNVGFDASKHRAGSSVRRPGPATAPEKGSKTLRRNAIARPGG